MPLALDNITHIIFDMDGTLVDSEPLWQKAEEVILARYDQTWQRDVAKHHIGVRLDEAAQIMVDRYHLPIRSSQLEDEIFAAMLDLIQTELTPMGGVEAFIQTAAEKGYEMGVASSSPLEYIQQIVVRCGWQDYMTHVVSAYQVPNGKPAPDVYLRAAELFAVDPALCLAFEDSLNGAWAAQAAGMRVVAIPGHDFTSGEFDGVADMTVASFTDVMW